MRHALVGLERGTIGITLVQYHLIGLVLADQHIELMTAGLVGQGLTGIFVRKGKEGIPFARLDQEFSDYGKRGSGFGHGGACHVVTGQPRFYAVYLEYMGTRLALASPADDHLS